MRIPIPTPSPLASSKQLSWQLLSERGDLDTEATAVVARVLQDTEAAKVVNLGRRFSWIFRSRCGQQLSGKTDVTAFDEWLGDAQTCGVRVATSFAASLNQDGDAVRAALMLPWRSGQAEVQITQLKLLKRAMYGRANLDVLRQFSLHPNLPKLVKIRKVGGDHCSILVNITFSRIPLTMAGRTL